MKTKSMKRVIITLIYLLAVVVFFSFDAFAESQLSKNLGVKSLTLNNAYSIALQLDSQKRVLELHGQSDYSKVTTYVDFERNPQKHTNEKIFFSGTVKQVVEVSNGFTVYRIAKDDDYDQMFYVEYTRPSDAPRILESDKVDVWAKFTELKTYSSTMNKSVTVPYCKAALITFPINNYQIKSAKDIKTIEDTIEDVQNRIKSLSKKDSNGNYEINTTSYEDYARNEAKHEAEKVYFSGKVLQVVEGSSYNTLRISVGNNSNNVVYVHHKPALDALRILEDDSVTVKGTYNGLYTYESTIGGDITIPYVNASTIDLKNYTEASTTSKDTNGYHYLTKSNFEAYSRRPGAHDNEKIRFNGKVLQVIEGTYSTEYRISVDSNSNYVIYVTLNKSNQTIRALEDDSVTVYGNFTGIISYTSTRNVKITIPSCTASKIDVSGASTITATKQNGSYPVTKNNYQSFARNDTQYRDQNISFTAKVVQVVEGSYTNVYRMSIDSDSNCMFYVTLNKSDMSVRILEDDVITAKGTFTGLYSYSSTYGGKITIPSCKLTSYSIKGYTAKSKGTKNPQGYYTVTKDNYELYARDEDGNKDSKITFSGKIIQVVEGSSFNVYRIAVDSDYNCIFYVEYTLPKGATRMLENDIVTLRGSYYGLYTYTTTMKSSVTVPAVIATEMKLGKTTSSPSSGNSPSSSSSNNGIGKVKIQAGTNVRAQADSGSSVVGYIEHETTLNYYSYSGGWYKIKLTNGTYGYVYQSRCQIVT